MCFWGTKNARSATCWQWRARHNRSGCWGRDQMQSWNLMLCIKCTHVIWHTHIYIYCRIKFTATTFRCAEGGPDHNGGTMKHIETPVPTVHLNLVGGLDHFLFFHILGWLSYFSEGLKPPTRNVRLNKLDFVSWKLFLPILGMQTATGATCHNVDVTTQGLHFILLV